MKLCVPRVERELERSRNGIDLVSAMYTERSYLNNPICHISAGIKSCLARADILMFRPVRECRRFNFILSLKPESNKPLWQLIC